MDTIPTLSRRISPSAWRGYSTDMTDAAIRAAYRLRYGVEPVEVLRGASIVLCGPVPETPPEVSNHPPAPKTPLHRS